MVPKLQTSSQASTWGIPPKVRRRLAKSVLDARQLLEDDFGRQFASLGVHADRIEEAKRKLTGAEEDVREAAAAVVDRAVAGGASRHSAFTAYVRDCAFTFLNKLIGLRCLEERGMLLVQGNAESAIRRDPRLGASSLYFRIRNDLPTDASPLDVWQATLDVAFRAVSERIGVIFDPDSEYGRLLPLQATLAHLIDGLNDPDIPSGTWADDEVLGWIYQYYNSEEQDTVYDKLRKGGKLEQPEELAAATCLYTERYMVDYLLQNTLGALWVEMLPETKLPLEWRYFARPVVKDSEQRDTNLPSRLRDLTLLDPACGGGHFLAAAFDLLAQMYEEEGIETASEIPQLIIERNLHGIDIDRRAVQISALRLYLKACDLGGPNFRPRRLNLVSADVIVPGDAPAELLSRSVHDRDVQQLVEAIWSQLNDASTLGSLLHPERRVEELLVRRRNKGDALDHQDERAWERFKLELLDGIREEFEKEAHSHDIGRRLFGQDLAKGVSFVEALSRRYDVVVTNPPYAGSRNLAEQIKSFVGREYKIGKADLFAAFILRGLEFLRPAGYLGMVTQQSWLFNKTFASLRANLLERVTLESVAQLRAGAFE